MPRKRRPPEPHAPAGDHRIGADQTGLEAWFDIERALEDFNRAAIGDSAEGLPDKKTHCAPRKGVASPTSRPLDWTSIERTLEVYDRSVEHTLELLDRALSTPVEAVASVASHIRNADPENKIMAETYFAWYATLLGPEISIGILRDHFGPAILKQSLAKKRGPTSVRDDDDHRIHVYVGAIMWVTGESMRRACERLAKMGLMVRKDATSGRAWVRLDEAETIRKRYMRLAN